MFYPILAFLCTISAYAFGQDAQPAAPQLPGFIDQLMNVQFLGKVFAFGAIVQMGCYCLAEFLTRLSDWLDQKSPAQPWLKKTAAYASEVSWFLGVWLGKVGYSAPKLVYEEKAKDLVAKGVVQAPPTAGK